MVNQEYFNELFERVTHSATMVPLSPLEQTWLEDYTAHREALTDEERECFDNQEIDEPFFRTKSA